MKDTRYKLIFTGKIQKGFRVEDVKKNTAKTFKIPTSVVDLLFSGGEQVVKKRGTREVCEKIKALLDQAGAVSRIEKEPVLKLEPRLDHPYHQRKRCLKAHPSPAV